MAESDDAVKNATPISEEQVAKAPVQMTCIVCGMGSTRASWENDMQTSIGRLVACDGHAKQEIQQALTRLKATISNIGSVKVPPRAPTDKSQPAQPDNLDKAKVQVGTVAGEAGGTAAVQRAVTPVTVPGAQEKKA